MLEAQVENSKWPPSPQLRDLLYAPSLSCLDGTSGAEMGSAGSGLGFTLESPLKGTEGSLTPDLDIGCRRRCGLVQVILGGAG